jgi:two-component system OmpR family sensor kinase
MADPAELPSPETMRREIAQLSADLAGARRDNRGYRNLLLAAAHEMRTPLNAIGLQLEMIGRLSGPEHEAARASQIDRAKRVLAEYVSRTSMLLDAARLNTGVFQLTREPLSLDKVVAAIADLYAAKADFQHARIDVRIAPGIVGRWDRAGVETILANLVSNALKYGEGTPVVISGETDDAGNAVIRIADSGPGIPENQRARIFEQFTRAVPNTTTVGYGLGLWIVKELALLHGGSIILDPTDVGSTFVVTLPVGEPMTTGRSVA